METNDARPTALDSLRMTMSQRISHSLLDPVLTLPMKRWYPWLPLPRQLPPEAIVLTGHGLAIMAAVGFAFSTQYWWGGLLIALGVAGNHIADVFDGTHARATGQCRNGGELLDHFLDPLSFGAWAVGLGVCAGRPYLALALVAAIQAQALLTSIRAKMTGEFRLSRVGPTEFKSLLVLVAAALAIAHGFGAAAV
ncbi:MAG: CDP-alcohol phosphatidyltransferase family protein, partial [Planctomycetales bacterium]|nr:CDP-alcohol phosphatidyltransferase family protein [Planctomycetales bacterium]